MVMKTAKEIKLNNQIYTVLECQACGATTRVKGKVNSNGSIAARERSCRSCVPLHMHRTSQGWWHEFGLDRNPGVYGPMPHKRTSLRYRLEEARRMGWMEWTWDDEYKEERKGVSIVLETS